MRKIRVCLFASLWVSLTLTVQSQIPFPDGGFENCWKEYQLGEPLPGKGAYWDFTTGYFLSTLNLLYDMPLEQGIAPLTAFRETMDVYNGNYSFKAVSNSMIFGDEIIFLPGVAATMYIDIMNLNCILGQPFTSRPKAMKGYFKYAPVGGDSAAIEVFLKTEGYMLGGGKKVVTGAVSDWQQFSIDIDYQYNMTPDSIVLIFASSGNYDFTNIETLMQCKGEIGSTLLLDEVEFVYESGIKEMVNPEIAIHIYPNPSTEQVTIQIGKETNGMIHVYDYLLRKVGEYELHGTQTSIDIKDYATGSYLINVVEKDKVITTSRFVKQ